MKESYIRKLYSNRIKSEKTAFSKTPKEKNEKKAVELEIIDFSLEEPDAMPDLFIIDALYREASKRENRGYTGDKGEIDFNNSAACHMENFYNVPKPDIDTEICVTNGTAAALNMLSLAFINRGDLSLITKPSSTSLERMTKWLGGDIISLPLTQKNKFFPKYEDIPQKSLKKAKLLYINYPNSPTGQTATSEFFRETVDFAKLNDLIVLHDAAYAALTYDNDKRISFLSVPGAKKVGAEIHSLSFGFNMAGWGIGFIAGNKNIVKALAVMRAKSGVSQYTAIRQAAAYALSHTEIAYNTAKKYERRASILVKQLGNLGFKAKKPKAGFYIYVKAPKSAGSQTFETSYDFESFLLSNGIKASAFEDGYIRFSAAFPTLQNEDEQRVMDEFYKRLADYEFTF